MTLAHAWGWAVVASYALLAWLLFDHGALRFEPLFRRLKYAALGLAFLCFGSGRLLILIGAARYWIFELGHIAFIAFGALYWLSGEHRCARFLRRRAATSEKDTG